MIRRPSQAAPIEELADSPAFRAGAEELAASLNRDPDEVLAGARACLDEMATSQRALFIRLWAGICRFMWARAYDLEVDQAGIDHLRALGRDHPLVVLPSHKSNLDGYVMGSVLHDHGFGPKHVLGGINMAFWPLGAIGRRVGVIWIRRSFGGDEVYKFALRRYLAFLTSRQLNLEWYIEGGRSRTGKLLPPRMGLLNYLARGVQEADGPEVLLAPVAVVYDRLEEVVEMTAESRGAAKQPESVRWLLRYAHSQSTQMGCIQVRFGEPLRLRAALAGAEGEARSLALSKVAFEVCTRINRATPVTSMSLATLALLGADGWAVTADATLGLVAPLRDYVHRRRIPGGDRLGDLTSAEGTRRVLRRLIDAGVVDEYADGAQRVYRISPARELAAAFYRNVIIHWFVNRAIIELALVAVAETPGRGDPVGAALAEALRLRDMLKFEFFFADKAEFEAELRSEIDLIAPTWRADDGAVLATVAASLAASGGLLADRILRSFVEAYWIVADRLVAAGWAEVAEETMVASCLRVGRQYLMQRRIVSGEAVSAELFKTGLKLAANRGLLDADHPDLPAGRAALAQELHDVLRRLEVLNRSEPHQRVRREGDRNRSLAPSTDGTPPLPASPVVTAEPA